MKTKKDIYVALSTIDAALKASGSILHAESYLCCIAKTSQGNADMLFDIDFSHVNRDALYNAVECIFDEYDRNRPVVDDSKNFAAWCLLARLAELS